MANVHYTTQNLSQYLNCFELFDLDKKKADQLSLCMSPGATKTIAGAMSFAGLQLLEERNALIKASGGTH